jgi:DNA invertase Pin-like site-specific DNA recombinase
MSIRRLRPGEPVPSGEPRRYTTSDGYVVLRWNVGVREHVEILEHRLVAGNPVGPVHHENRNRMDNEPGNLRPTADASEHGRLHAQIDRQEVRTLYESGLTTIEVADRLGTHPGNVSRMLRQAGGEARPPRLRRPDLDRDEIDRRLRDGEPILAIARAMGCSRTPVYARVGV